MSLLHMKPITLLAEAKPHGTRVKYLGGCRCLPCRAANAGYECRRVRARRSGDWNGLIPAGRARQHLLALSRAGVGRRTVADIAGVPQSLLHRIRTGRRRRIRARTARRILLVSRTAMNDARLVPAGRAWRMIDRLVEEGFTRAEIARRLGYRSRALQLNRARITARSLVRVERFYRRMMT
ncbi:MAG TPA: hypothetical protein VNJ12_06765 [Candidatus Dormibacteraeota bacterium]|nr:hypothetical protein [Candidatus Dormibacteraeota bacterium]